MEYQALVDLMGWVKKYRLEKGRLPV